MHRKPIKAALKLSPWIGWRSTKLQPDHPRAREQSSKIQIGPLERLPCPRPIPSRKWRRITFLYTTSEKLRAAEELNDLIVHAGEH